LPSGHHAGSPAPPERHGWKDTDVQAAALFCEVLELIGIAPPT
jgi:hypothetical protein